MDESGDIVELIAPPHEPLEAKINGVPVPVNAQLVAVWTIVAGWLGQYEVLAKLQKAE